MPEQSGVKLRVRDDGSASVVAALLAVPLAIFIGAAVDYARVNSTTTGLRAALDSAVLSAAARETGFNADQASIYFNSNWPPDTATITSLQFSQAADGTIVGTMEATVPTGLMALAGINDAKVAITAKAKTTEPEKLATVTLQITNAQGAYDKEIYFFTKDKDGNVLDEQLVLNYDYTYKSGKGTKTYTPPQTSAITIDVGAYQTVGERMVVYEDTSYTGKHIKPKSYSSDDPNATSWTKASGDCETGQTQNWEDGGDSNYLDFVFTMSCTTSSAGSRVVRLVE